MTTSSHPGTSTATRPRSHWGLLAVLCGAIFLEGIDVAMVNVALPSIRAELGLSPASLHWVVSAYVLGYAGFMLLGGRAADLLGRRRMFVLPLVVFIAFSGLGGLATEGWMVILARFVTGVAAAFMTPAGLSLITTTFPEGQLRNRALLIYSGTAAGGFTLGLVIGGLLTVVSWRLVFLAPVALATLVLLGALALLDRSVNVTTTDRPASFDAAGALTLTAAMVLIVLAVTELGAASQLGMLPVALGVAGVALLVLFWRLESTSPNPLVRLGILRQAPLLRANVAALLFAASFFGFQFTVTLYLQDLLGWTPWQTSIALLVVSSDAILSPTLTPVLVRRFGNTRVIVVGLLLAVAAYALFLRAGADWTYAAMLPTMLLLGLAFSLAYGPLTIAGTDGVADHEQGLAGGLLYTSFQFGAAVGLSLVSVVLAQAAGAGSSLPIGAIRAAILVPLVAAVLAVVVMVPARSRLAR